ncbi:Nudix family hydrolase [Nitrosospira sp. Nsp1]|uniref:Nudix family hydrolase n=1 Tax=Nitrosospira sp. Nsp1 TaxID=136547 RepID=UPI003524815E
MTVCVACFIHRLLAIHLTMPSPTHITEVAVAVITAPDGRFLLARRPEGKPYAGYWEFPGGKVNPDEPLLHALRRELLEELGIFVEHAYPWITRTFNYSHASVRLYFYRVVKWHGQPQPRENQELAWQSAANVWVEPMLPANAPVLRALDLPAIYAITNAAELGTDIALTRIEHALKGGVRLLQVREKAMPEKALNAFIGALIALGHRHGARVLVNGSIDNIDFYRKAGVDGLHLASRQLMDIAKRPDVEWCGASCHNAEELFRAEQLGMDFAVLAPVLPTLSHPGSATLGWQRFAALIRDCSIPVYALGGLHREDLTTAWEHGAHGVAMMRGIG